jgi:hypothetical protein
MAASALPIDTPTLPAPCAEAAPLHQPGVARHGRPGWRQLARSFGWLPAPPDGANLQAARAEFTTCLADLPQADTRPLQQLLAHAQSLAELWHLRPELYRHLALHHSQAEASRRLAALDRWFASA